MNVMVVMELAANVKVLLCVVLLSAPSLIEVTVPPSSNVTDVVSLYTAMTVPTDAVPRVMIDTPLCRTYTPSFEIVVSALSDVWRGVLTSLTESLMLPDDVTVVADTVPVAVTLPLVSSSMLFVPDDGFFRFVVANVLIFYYLFFVIYLY
jgi:hypothetical protein